MAQSIVLGNLYGKGSLLIWRLSNISEDMWHWRAAVRWFILLAAAQGLGQKKTQIYLFLGISACVCSHAVILVVLLLVIQAIPKCCRTGSCCLAVVPMQFAACLKHRVSGQGWDCCCQAGRSSRSRLLICCCLNAQLWSPSGAHPDKVAGTHVFLQAYLLLPAEMGTWVSKHAQRLSYHLGCVMGKNCVTLIHHWQIFPVQLVNLLKFISWDVLLLPVTSVLPNVLTGKHDQEGKKMEISSQRRQILQPLNHSNLQ